MSENTDDITVLTEYFYPEEAATAQLLTSLATGLQGRFDVSVLTAPPNYHADDQEAPVPPTECHNGVDIERVPATRLDKDTLSLRVINWLSFTLLIFWRLVWTRDAGDRVLVLSNPPLLPFAAWAAKKLRGFSYAYLIHDLYPDVPIGLGMLDADSLFAQAWDWSNRRVYRDADRIVVLGETMQARLTDTVREDPRFDPGKIEVIPNWEDGSFIAPKPKAENPFAREHGLVDSFTLLYSGNIGRFHELRTAIDAIGRLGDRGRTDITLVIVGEGAQKENHRRYVEQNDIRNVRFFPFQPIERLPETLTACDAFLVGIVSEVTGMCVSSKLYSALAAGRPVLAVTGEDDEVTRTVRAHDCGAHVPPGRPDTAADTLASWADDPDTATALGQRARTAFENHYTKAHAVEAYARLFEQMPPAARGQ